MHPLLQAAHDLAPQIRAAAAEAEQNGKLTPAIAQAMIKSGLFRIVVPKSLGGYETDLPTYARIVEEIAKADASAAWVVSQCGATGMNSAYLPEKTAKEIYSDPNAVIIHSHGPRCQAVRVDGGYRVTGRWTFSTGCHHATWFSGDVTLPEALEGRRGTHREAYTVFLPAKEAEIVSNWNVSGMRATGSDAFVATDLFVPEHHAITLPRGQCRESSTLFAFSPRWAFACGFASVALGVARSLLDVYADLAANKIPRAASRVLRDNAVVQAETGRAEARYRAARALLHETLRDAWQAAEETGAVTDEHRVLLRLATTHAMNESVLVAAAVHQAGGATAIDEDAPFARPYRDMQALKQHIQANPMHYESTGQYFLGLDADMTWM